MSVLTALFLGIVQGIAEFLPISSSGHLAILHNFLSIGYEEDDHLLFDVLLHLGTLVSIITVYRAEIKEMITDGLSYLRMRADSNADEPVYPRPPARTLLFIIVGTLPLVFAAILSPAIQRSIFPNTFFIGFALIVTGTLLYVSSRYIKQGNKTDKTMTIGDAILIGLAQMVAVLPGLSRSGTTIAVGLSRGLTGAFAVRFSLLLSIPAVVAAALWQLIQAITRGVDIFALLPTYLAGFVMAAGVGFLAIQFIRRMMAKNKFGTFSYYCWAVGALTIILSFFF